MGPQKAFDAIHLRIEPDMNRGHIMSLSKDCIIQQLDAPNIPKNIAIFVASGVAEDIMDQLPDGYQWFNRFNIVNLNLNDEIRQVVKNLSDEQLSLVDLEVSNYHHIL